MKFDGRNPAKQEEVFNAACYGTLMDTADLKYLRADQLEVAARQASGLAMNINEILANIPMYVRTRMDQKHKEKRVPR